MRGAAKLASAARVRFHWLRTFRRAGKEFGDKPVQSKGGDQMSPDLSAACLMFVVPLLAAVCSGPGCKTTSEPTKSAPPATCPGNKC
jgi:hypothetical protein